MKKGLLAVAVAGALSLGAAQAETVLYGSLRMSYNNVKVTDPITGDSERVSDMRDETSRVGIKGSEDLGNGVKILFQAEWRTQVMEGHNNQSGFDNRLGWIGIAGDFGTVKIGRQWSPIWSHGIAGNIKDDFHADVASVTAADIVINSIAFPVGITRLGNSISYETPNFSGFKAIAMVTMDDSSIWLQEKKHVDIYQLGASYNHESGFYGKLGFAQGHMTADKSRVWSAQLGYKVDQFGVTAGYTDGKHKHNLKAKGWDLGASYSFGNDYASTVRAGYGQAKVKTDVGSNSLGKVKTWAVGFEQKLSSRTLVWAEYGQERVKPTGGSTLKDDGFSLGIRHDF